MKKYPDFDNIQFLGLFGFLMSGFLASCCIYFFLNNKHFFVCVSFTIYVINAWPQCKVFLVLPLSVQIFLCSKNQSWIIYVKAQKKKTGSDNYVIGASVEIKYVYQPNELYASSIYCRYIFQTRILKCNGFAYSYLGQEKNSAYISIVNKYYVWLHIFIKISILKLDEKLNLSRFFFFLNFEIVIASLKYLLKKQIL